MMSCSEGGGGEKTQRLLLSANGGREGCIFFVSF